MSGISVSIIDFPIELQLLLFILNQHAKHSMFRNVNFVSIYFISPPRSTVEAQFSVVLLFLIVLYVQICLLLG